MEKFNYDKYIGFKNYYKIIVDRISSLRMIVFIFMVISFIIGSSNSLFNVIGIFLIIGFIILIFIHDKYYKLMNYYDKYVMVIDQYKSRINGEWRSFADNGDDFQNELFSDLDIVGDNSLFQYLSVCKTIGGRNRLIERLSNKKFNNKELKYNQEAIKELCDNVNFDIDFQVNMLEYDNKRVDLLDSFNYLEKKVGNKNIDFVIGVILSFLSIILLILGLLGVVSINYFYGLFVFNFLANFMYSYIYKEDFESISKVSYDYSKLSKIYKSVLKVDFNSKILIDIYNNINECKDSVDKLVKIDNFNSLKNNILSSFIFNGLFCINIMVMFMYFKFQSSDVSSLKMGVNSISELEALISLSGIGIIREDVCIPVVESEMKLEFKNLKHPLIDKDRCVGNDFASNDGVNIITGSNMGGKTSFLRTIGVNLILMNAGTYVCASSFVACYLKIFTSISVNDDIGKGISTFYGELLRMKNAMVYDSGSRIILVDEIFKGTNYQDRMYGAINVIRKLNDKKTILFITTHDFELCDVKVSKLRNYYFKEYYEGGSIKFDYKIRTGKCESTNAKYLMKELNIID